MDVTVDRPYIAWSEALQYPYMYKCMRITCSPVCISMSTRDSTDRYGQQTRGETAQKYMYFHCREAAAQHTCIHICISMSDGTNEWSTADAYTRHSFECSHYVVINNTFTYTGESRRAERQCALGKQTRFEAAHRRCRQQSAGNRRRSPPSLPRSARRRFPPT